MLDLAPGKDVSQHCKPCSVHGGQPGDGRRGEIISWIILGAKGVWEQSFLIRRPRSVESWSGSATASPLVAWRERREGGLRNQICQRAFIWEAGIISLLIKGQPNHEKSDVGGRR